MDWFFSFHLKKKKRKLLNYPYQLLLEDHLLEPLEIQRFEGGEDEERVLLVAFGLLDGSFWIRDPQGGFGSHVFAVTKHRRFIQPWGTETRASLAKTHDGDDGICRKRTTLFTSRRRRTRRSESPGTCRTGSPRFQR